MRGNAAESEGISATAPAGACCDNPAKPVVRDEPLTPGVSDSVLLDLRDALMAGARALLEDKVHDSNKRAELAHVLRQAARQIERTMKHQS